MMVMVPAPSVCILVHATTDFPERPAGGVGGLFSSTEIGLSVGVGGGLSNSLLISLNVTSPWAADGFNIANGNATGVGDLVLNLLGPEGDFRPALVHSRSKSIYFPEIIYFERKALEVDSLVLCHRKDLGATSISHYVWAGSLPTNVIRTKLKFTRSRRFWEWCKGTLQHANFLSRLNSRERLLILHVRCCVLLQEEIRLWRGWRRSPPSLWRVNLSKRIWDERAEWGHRSFRPVKSTEPTNCQFRWPLSTCIETGSCIESYILVVNILFPVTITQAKWKNVLLVHTFALEDCRTGSCQITVATSTCQRFVERLEA